VRLKRHEIERNEKLKKTTRIEAQKKGGYIYGIASMPTHATPGRPKANEEQGWAFGSDPKATKAKATNCQRVWVLN